VPGDVLSIADPYLSTGRYSPLFLPQLSHVVRAVSAYDASMNIALSLALWLIAALLAFVGYHCLPTLVDAIIERIRVRFARAWFLIVSATVLLLICVVVLYEI
jgi:hypothetical protein